jgi:hypothetical protein
MNSSINQPPTIPIKQVVLNKKFIPLVVGSSTIDNVQLQAKLFDVNFFIFK